MLVESKNWKYLFSIDMTLFSTQYVKQFLKNQQDPVNVTGVWTLYKYDKVEIKAGQS